MGSWRRQKGISRRSHQGFQGTTSQDTNPPPPPCNWQPTVPAWEKKFCSAVGSVPWHKIEEAKKFMCLYKNIIDWDDSAGEEAFWNAKNRFWAEINCLPCDISLPDPDKYVDRVDWDSAVDVELLLDLDRDPASIPESYSSGSGKIIFGNALLDQSFSCTGWGDCDENFAKAPGQWDNNSWCKNPWEDNHNAVGNDQGWGEDWNDWLAKNPKFGECRNDSWCKDPWEEDLKTGGKDEEWGTKANNFWGWNEMDDSNFNEFDNACRNPGEKRFSGSFGQGYNWSNSNHRNRNHQRGLKRNGALANNALRA
ncbi:hypothetical protein MLD38_025989 [Melastoma candidum]|uniref:Uncharacterized protein n=1 Tax=Melastoma candidum TaxID=119954 RepID=A0ACB9NYQ8_9MYRT|nr:hypothetical protein MLD38_025989 [Melastoma candidum]